jgi:hypothetical protein
MSNSKTKAKTNPRTTPEEQRFYKFAKALIAVPKKEIDKAEAQYQKEQAKKHAKQKH